MVEFRGGECPLVDYSTLMLVGPDAVVLDPVVQLTLAATEVVMHFLLTPDDRIEVIEASVLQARIECPQVNQIERVLISFIERSRLPSPSPGRVS